MRSRDWPNPWVWQLSGCCTADSQTDEDKNQLYHNQQIAKFKDLACPWGGLGDGVNFRVGQRVWVVVHNSENPAASKVQIAGVRQIKWTDELKI